MLFVSLQTRAFEKPPLSSEQDWFLCLAEPDGLRCGCSMDPLRLAVSHWALTLHSGGGGESEALD